MPRPRLLTPRTPLADYISILALSAVAPGVAPFMMVPGSLAAARRASAGIPAAEQADVDGMLCRTMLPGRLRELGVQAVLDGDPDGREIYMEEGDMLLLVRTLDQLIARWRDSFEGVWRHARTR